MPMPLAMVMRRSFIYLYSLERWTMCIMRLGDSLFCFLSHPTQYSSFFCLFNIPCPVSIHSDNQSFSTIINLHWILIYILLHGIRAHFLNKNQTFFTNLKLGLGRKLGMVEFIDNCLLELTALGPQPWDWERLIISPFKYNFYNFLIIFIFF